MADVVLVVAVARNGVIGNRGALPWHLPADLKHFKALTMGKPMIMGRKTFQSIGRPLPGRDTVVITRQADFSAEGVHVARSWDAAWAIAERLAKIRGADEIPVVGGAEIYALALPHANRIYLTEVNLEPQGDAFFPPLDPAEWAEVAAQDHPATGDAPAWRAVTYARRSS
ncbi:MAG: dihydrofolate reductase [Alphaproteobacteria bacterium]|nr:MAG: dihydrofolate reductase [Alphaproteobacteria bacterium]